MNSNGSPSSTIEKVATKIERHMREKCFRPGDKYLTAAEASKLFSVNTMSIHRAMQSLAGREVLVRKRNQGTFVGPNFRYSDHAHQDFEIIHLVMAMDYHITQDFSSDALVDEFAKSASGATVQVHHIHENGALRYIDQVIDRIGDSSREGLVLIRCSREVQLRVAKSRLPSVVFGHAYPGVQLSCVKHDQAAVGRAMAEYALERGAQRFALLTHARWRFGDNAMVDSATEVLGSAGVQLGSVKIRSMSPEREAVEHVVRSIMQIEEPPDAFLCRTDFYAQIVKEVLESEFSTEKPATASRDIGSIRRCVVSGGHSPALGARPFARVVSTMSLRDQVERVTRLMADTVRDSELKPFNLVIPVKLCLSELELENQ